MNPFILVNKKCDALAEQTGCLCILFLKSIGSLGLFCVSVLRSEWRWGRIIEQMYLLGNKSLSFVAMSSTFVGFITIMTYNNLTARLNVEPSVMGMMVSRVVFMELGPALVGLILAGKIGARIASEISYMQISEQIDAYTCLSLSPVGYLIKPRVIACLAMGPVFFVVSSLTAILSSQVFALVTCGVSAGDFYSGMKGSFKLIIVMMGLTKVTLFSLTNAVIGCYFGFRASGGATGIGRATRNTVVSSSLLILLENILLTKFMI